MVKSPSYAEQNRIKTKSDRSFHRRQHHRRRQKLPGLCALRLRLRQLRRQFPPRQIPNIQLGSPQHRNLRRYHPRPQIPLAKGLPRPQPRYPQHPDWCQRRLVPVRHRRRIALRRPARRIRNHLQTHPYACDAKM